MVILLSLLAFATMISRALRYERDLNIDLCGDISYLNTTCNYCQLDCLIIVYNIAFHLLRLFVFLILLCSNAHSARSCLNQSLPSNASRITSCRLNIVLMVCKSLNRSLAQRMMSPRCRRARCVGFTVRYVGVYVLFSFIVLS